MLPVDTSFKTESYTVYSHLLMESLFEGEDLNFLLKYANNHHQANRLVMHFIIKDRGPMHMLENFPEHTELISYNWEIIKETILFRRKVCGFGHQIADHLNLQPTQSLKNKTLTFEQKTVWKDLCSYRNWAWQKNRNAQKDIEEIE